ncbi:MAG: hypothetical protein ACREM1_24240, partial [Longimicrobiales bacterium]
AGVLAASRFEACGGGTHVVDGQAEHKGGPTGSGIMYVRDRIRNIDYPAYEGERYSATIADTLDLHERCRLATHGLTSMTDPTADYEIYGWMGFPRRGTILARHSYHDYNGAEAKWIEALPLLRTVSGSTEQVDVDGKMMQTLFHMLGPDGLYYIPVVGSPWAVLLEPNEVAYADMTAKQIFNSWPTGRVLMALACWYDRTHASVYKSAIERMVDGLNGIARRKDDYCYFLEKKFDNRYPSEDMPTGGGAAVTQPTIFTGLALAYKFTKYERARELATMHLRYMLGPAKWFQPNGSWHQDVHFHGTTFGIQGLLEFGLATRRPDLVRTAQRAYEFGRSQGIPAIGWFPESYPATHAHVETCHVADMTILAVRLSASGVGDYWEDVEHYVRNQLQSNQVIDSAWLLDLAKRNLDGRPPRPGVETADRVAERMVGTFNGMAAANGLYQPTSSNCCTGNGARALYFAWKHILRDRSGLLHVNLLLNRASTLADVNSYLPYTGRVEVHMKQARRLRVRIPSWVAAADVTCSVNGRSSACSMVGRYLDVGRVAPGDKVVVEFPPSRSHFDVVAGAKTPAPFNRAYAVEMKGFVVVALTPKDPRPEEIIVPAYTRADYREDTPRFRTTTRFAPYDELRWAD